MAAPAATPASMPAVGMVVGIVVGVGPATEGLPPAPAIPLGMSIGSWACPPSGISISGVSGSFVLSERIASDGPVEVGWKRTLNVVSLPASNSE